MKRPRGRGLAGIGISVLLALVIAGCGRSSPAIDVGGASVAPDPAALTQGAALATSTPTGVAATPTSTSTIGLDPMATPVPTPDFQAIETLMSGINADLGMDATAETDEGNPQ